MAEWMNSNIPTFSWMSDASPSPGVASAFALGFQAKQHALDRELRVRELDLRADQQNILHQLRTEELNAKRVSQEGVAALASVMGNAAKREFDPESEALLWETASHFPAMMTRPEFREFTQQFELARTARMRNELLKTQITGREDLESIRQQHRLESIASRMDRIADMKFDDQDFKVKFEALQQEHRLERDKVKASSGGQERFDLNKSDEIAMRADLQSLQTAFNQGILESAEFDKKRDATIAKYRAKARTTQAAPAPTATTPANPGEPARVTSQAEFDALPSGALFINPADGKVLRKK